jgi:hypothetical protein
VGGWERPIVRAGLWLLAVLAFPVLAQPPEPPSPAQTAPPPLALRPEPPGPPASPPAVPAEQVAPLELTGLLSHTIVGKDGSELGHIVDLLVDGQGHIRAVVVNLGGFLGVGDRKVAIGWSALRFAQGPKGPVISVLIPPDRIRSWADYIVGRPVAILGAPDTDP